MFTFVRRSAAAVLISAALIVPALAQDWREQYPELTIGISSGENETDAIARNEPYADYLSRELGVPVKIVRGTDYAAVIEAMRSGHVQIASVGRLPTPWRAKSWARPSLRLPLPSMATAIAVTIR
jgi:phosphonate transport system substrate-binding protein